MADAARVDAQNPWPGLASFTEADRAFFRGREAEADELARMVRRERLTVLLGRSGLGKSSLLSAGLFPRLRGDGLLPVPVRIGYGASLSPRQQLWAALASACAEAAVETTAPEPTESMWSCFHRRGGGFWNRRRRPVLPVLVFDQFEEMFTLGQADEGTRAAANHFADELADLVEDRPSDELRRALDTDPSRLEALDFERAGCKVLISFREDYLAEVEGLRARMPSVTRNRFRLLPMNVVQARSVIASGGDLVSAEVGERIVGLAWRNRAEAPAPDEDPAIEIDPALLSVICSELNQRRLAAGEPTIAPALLAGAETEILSAFYERSMRGADPALRRFVEDELITTAGYRDSFAFDDALARPGVTADALWRLVSGRLLRVDERFGVRRLELTHDVLTRIVKDSRDARRAREAEAAALRLERDAARRQQRARRRERVVWAGGVLAALLLAGAVLAGRWAIERDHAAQAAESRASEQRQQADEATALLERAIAEALAAGKRAAQALAAAAAASQAADAASQAAGKQTLRANRVERDALATDLIVAARTAPADAPQLSLLLGAEAVRRYPQRLDGQVELLARLVAAHRLRRVVDFDTPLLASAAIGDGTRVLVGTQGGQLALVDARSGEVVGRWALPPKQYGLQVQQMNLRVSADARVALLEVDGTPMLARLLPGQPLLTQPVGGSGGGRYLALSADGTRLAEANQAWPEVKLHAVLDGVAEAAPRRIALPRLAGFGCLSFEAAPGQLIVGTQTETHAVRLADGKVTTVALPRPALAFSADCTKALVRDSAEGGEPRFRTIDARTGTSLRTLRVLAGTQPRQMIGNPVFVAAGRYVVATFAEGVELWPVDDDTARTWPQELLPDVVGASADGRWLAYGVSGGQLELQRLAEPRFRTRFKLPEPPAALHFAADGGSLAVVGRGRLLQWVRLSGVNALTRGQQPFRAGEIEFSADGSHLGAAPANGVGGLALWNVAGAPAQALELRFSRIEFGLGGQLMATYDSDDKARRVRIFELRQPPRPQVDIDLASESGIRHFAFDADGRRLAIAVKRAIVIADLRTGGLRERIELPDHDADRLAFHPREPVIAAVHADGSVRTYSLSRLHESWRIGVDSTQPETLADSAVFSTDGRWLLVGRKKGVIAMHDARSGALYVTLVPPRENAAPAGSLAFVEGTSIVAAGALDGAKDFWDVSARRWLGAVGADAQVRGGGEADLKAVAVSARGRQVALRHADDTVSLHQWDPSSLVRGACAISGRNLSCQEWRRFMRDEPYRATCDALPPPVPACR
ncbi:MAG: WD40 repeat domain-containing protein [Rubrivivax sp.]|nr:WD40 repeat domain-containing protein [Rubrivivax sp.]